MKFDNEQAKFLARFIAKNMIAREDVKASQLPRGQGAYVRNDSKWTMKDLIAHVTGEETYGHYLLDRDSRVKIIAFDIDLNQHGWYIPYANEDLLRYSEDASLMDNEHFIECNPREAWLDRKHPARPWLKHQMRELAERFTDACYWQGLRTFATYSGNKGIHVYGLLDERTPAAEARLIAFDVLERVAGSLRNYEGDHRYKIESSKGKSFYYISGYAGGGYAPLYRRFDNFSIEVFPKQDHIEPNRLGNLMRLPFGTNLKNPKDPTFVIDQGHPAEGDVPSSSLAPITDFDTLKERLEQGHPWRDASHLTRDRHRA